MVDGLFRDVLLSTSRVIWPATWNVRITLAIASRHALVREYLALIAYPMGSEIDARNRFVTALEDLIAWRLVALQQTDPNELPSELRHPPRPREIRSALRPGLSRLRRAFEIAHELGLAEGDIVAAVKARAGRKRGNAYSARYVYRREAAPLLPFLHLPLPLVAVRTDGLAERMPELAPDAIPRKTADLITTDSWPLVALDAAELWRELLAPTLGPMIQVRARWVGV
jgi:hypothetical protein